MRELPQKYVDSPGIQWDLMVSRRFSWNLVESIGFGWILMDTGICAWKKWDTQDKWSQRVAECRQSGLSVRQWCNEQGINPKTYYYWQRKLFQIAQQQAQIEFTSVPVLQPDTESSVVATLRNGDFVVDLYRGAYFEVIQAICHALQSC